MITNEQAETIVNLIDVKYTKIARENGFSISQTLTMPPVKEPIHYEIIANKLGFIHSPEIIMLIGKDRIIFHILNDGDGNRFSIPPDLMEYRMGLHLVLRRGLRPWESIDDYILDNSLNYYRLSIEP
jgi:hypothetical protein